MSFLGKTISFQVFHPNLSVPISRRADAVVGDGVEFEDVKKLQLPGSDVVNADIDISANRISYVIDTASWWFAETPGFNGGKFSDEFDTIDPIVSVQIVSGDKPLSLAPDAVFFSENAIFFDVDGLSFQRGSTIDLVVTFGSPEDAGSSVPIDIQAVARLYAASFARTPDEPGLNYWIDQIDAGMELGEIATNFFLSAEFAKLFGAPASLSDHDLVQILYQNILSRPGEQAGVDFWLDMLANGYARSNLLIDFATGPENVALTGYVADMAQNLSGTEWIIA